MLSKVEAEFLRNPEAFSADYAKQLKHRIRTKVLAVGKVMEDIALLESAGFLVTGSSTEVTDSHNLNLLQNQKMVGLPGFEPGSIEPKSTSLDQTSRQPRGIWNQRTIIWHEP